MRQASPIPHRAGASGPPFLHAELRASPVWRNVGISGDDEGISTVTGNGWTKRVN
jgi:hypothetical protein